MFREVEPNAGVLMLVGTDNAVTIAGRCDGTQAEDEDAFGVGVSDVGESVFISLKLEWDALGGNGRVLLFGAGAVASWQEPPGVDQLEAEVFTSDPNDTVTAVVSCGPGASFDYRGKFGIR